MQFVSDDLLLSFLFYGTFSSFLFLSFIHLMQQLLDSLVIPNLSIISYHLTGIQRRGSAVETRPAWSISQGSENQIDFRLRSFESPCLLELYTTVWNHSI